jgi:hypothetical protein
MSSATADMPLKTANLSINSTTRVKQNENECVTNVLCSFNIRILSSKMPYS